MAGLTKLRCIFPLVSGLAEIECWANSPDSEIVTHPFLGAIQGQSDKDGRWVLTHRRSGRGVSADSFPTVESALVIAAELDAIEDFKKIRVYSLEEGPVNDDAFMQSLRDQVQTRLAEFVSTPQQDQRSSPDRTIP